MESTCILVMDILKLQSHVHYETMFSRKFTHINQAKGVISRESLLRRVRLETQHLGKVEKSPIYKGLKRKLDHLFQKGQKESCVSPNPYCKLNCKYKEE